VSTSLFSYALDIDIDQIKQKESQFRTDSRVNNTFLLPKNFTLKWDVIYQSPMITAQSKRDAYVYSNLAVKKGFKDNQWSVVLSWANIFNSIRYSSISKGTDFYIKESYIQEPYVSFKVSYNFDNQK
jgi:hypothetical protein